MYATLIRLGLFLLPLLITSTHIQAQPAPIVETAQGPIQGVEAQSDTWGYFGIPFAAPPTGNLRWRAPQDAENWTRTLDASRKPIPCIQRGGVGALGSEDCLYLNLWQPKTPSAEALPVMVWIHGGGNVLGGSASPIYDAANFAATGDVIVISLQYRLGFQGFFNLPALHTGNPLDDSGNFALLDQMKALEWVQENAAAFGGDPTRVTVFGESAGGMNTWSLMVSDIADGLFHRAIIESGCPTFIPKEFAQNSAQSAVEFMIIADGLATEENAEAFLAAQDDRWVSDYLYGKDSAEMMQILADAGAIDMSVYYGIEDGYVLPESALLAVEEGRYTGVPSIIGSNRDESKLFFSMFYGMGAFGYNKAMNTLYPEDREAVESLYPMSDYNTSDYYSRFADTGDWYLELACGTYGAMLAAEHHNVWTYKFEYDNLNPPFDQQIAASHLMEVPVVFGHFNSAIHAEGSEDEFNALSHAMRSSWTCFAKTGDPNSCEGTVPWPILSTSDQANMKRILWDTPVSTGIIGEAEREKIDYWLTTRGLSLLESSRSQEKLERESHQEMVDWLGDDKQSSPQL